jgi:hypothetical protein
MKPNTRLVWQASADEQQLWVKKQLTSRIATTAINRGPSLTRLKLFDKGSEVASLVRGTKIVRKHGEPVRNPIFHICNPLKRGLQWMFSSLYRIRKPASELRWSVLIYPTGHRGIATTRRSAWWVWSPTVLWSVVIRPLLPPHILTCATHSFL